MRLNNEKGITLIMALLVIVVLIIFGGIFIARSINEWNATRKNYDAKMAFYIAEGGAEAGLFEIDNIINVDLLNTINQVNPQTVSTKAQQHVTSADGMGFLLLYALDGGTDLFALDGTTAVHSQGSTSFAGGIYSFNVKVEQKGSPTVISTDAWDFPFNYRVESTGTYSGISKKILMMGDFTVRVQRDNFAKYALFTDHHGLPNGTTVWFTDKTNFAGPLHTNERYSFARNPSGIFEGKVTQHLQDARFYNGGSPKLMDADYNADKDVPIFHGGYERKYDEIVLASSVQKLDLYGQARGGEATTGDGIFIVNDGAQLTGGIYVHGNATINLGLDASDNAQYTIEQGGTTKIITVDIPDNQTQIQTDGGEPETYAGLPDGVDNLGTIIYVDGEVSSLAGTVQRNTEVTISSENDVIISNNIKYSNYTPAVGAPGNPSYVPPNASGATNLLGILSWGGNVRIGTMAPNDINIHGIIMARNGQFQVDNYNDAQVGSRGKASLLGGVITQFYGAFGLFDGSDGSQLSGYGRNFVYDSRTSAGKSPPYFPSMKTFIAFSNNITDQIVFQEGGF